MKNFIYALVVIITLSFTSCQLATKENNQADLSAIKDSLALQVQIDTAGLHGTWEMAYYFDSVTTHRAVAKYRLAPFVWSHLLFDIKGDSLFYFGSLPLHGKQKLSFQSDTLFQNKSWSLIRQNNGVLQLLTSQSGDNPVRKKYFYKKNNQWQAVFAKYHKGTTEYFKLFRDQTIARFNKKIFAGKYEYTSTKEQVIFKPDGSLIGITHFDKYEVRPYFGTHHPHKNLDVITFIATQAKDYKQYHWKFEGKELVLVEFVKDKANDMDFVPGAGKIVLKQLEKY